MFQSFLYDGIKQYAETATSHSKRIIGLLKQYNIISCKLIKIWGNKYGCAEHYRCATALYLFSMLPRDFSVIIYHYISVPGNGIEVVDGLKDI